MKRINSLLSAGVTLTSSGTAVAAPIPLDSAGYFPRFVRVVATGAGCFVKVGDIGVTAVSGDCMIQPLDGTVLNVRGCKAISAISVSGTSSVTVVPLEAGSWNYDQRTLDYNFTTLSAVPSTVTFTRGSSATYFGSDGLLKVQGYNLLLQSANVSVSPWSNIGTASAPSASTVLLPLEGDFRTQAITLTITAGQAYTFSAKLSGTGTVALRVFRSGAGVSEGTATTFTLSSTPTRCSVTHTFANAQTALRVDILRNTGNTATSVTVDELQLEAGSTATQYSPTTTAANSAPRLDYDPATLLPRGLLVEEQRTNLLLHSRDMTQAAWTKTDVTAARTQVGIDGTANSACLMTEGSAGTAAVLQDAGSGLTPTNPLSTSVFLKRGNTDILRLIFATTAGDGMYAWVNLATGAVLTTSAAGAGTAISATPENCGNGFYRFKLVCTPNGVGTVGRVGIASATASGGTTRVSGATYIVDAAQLEVGSFATSPIPTTTASATRSADSALMNGTNFSSWYNQTQGTFVVETDNSSITTSSLIRVISVDSGSTADVLEILRDTTTSNDIRGILTLNSVSQYDTAGSATDGSFIIGRNKLALAVSAGLTADRMTGNGVAVYSPSAKTTDPATRTMTTLFIGNRRALDRAMNGHIRRLQFYPVALPAATLTSLTT